MADTYVMRGGGGAQGWKQHTLAFTGFGTELALNIAVEHTTTKTTVEMPQDMKEHEDSARLRG